MYVEHRPSGAFYRAIEAGDLQSQLNPPLYPRSERRNSSTGHGAFQDEASPNTLDSACRDMLAYFLNL